MARITVQPGRYQEAAIILLRDGVAVGEIVVLAVYERRRGEMCVTLGLELPDGLQAARLDSAPLPEEWDGWIAEREVKYAAQYQPFTLAAQRSAGNGGMGGDPGSASSGRWPKPPRNGGGSPAKSSGRWRKPDGGKQPSHGRGHW